MLERFGLADWLGDDPTKDTEWHQPDDRYVPVRCAELAAALSEAESIIGPSANEICAVADALRDVLDQEARSFERGLCEIYALVNPDRDTVLTRPLSELRTDQTYQKLDRQLGYLLDKANFELLNDVQIERAVATANTHGLKVKLNPDKVESLQIWLRGKGHTQRTKRTWRHPLKGETFTVEVYRRLVVIARLKDDPHVILKMFKDIPVEDLEALLPHAEVHMTLLDRLKLWGGGAGVVGSTGMKIFSASATLAKGIAGLAYLGWLILVGAGILVVRTFTGYRTAKVTRVSQRTQHLYFQNLGNNRSVLHTLIAMIADEELKEALLAYAFAGAGKQPADDAQALCARIEEFLSSKMSVNVQFEIADALETLKRLELLASEEPIRIVTPDEAIERLHEHWQVRRSWGYHRDMCMGGKPSAERLQKRAERPTAGGEDRAAAGA